MPCCRTGPSTSGRKVPPLTYQEYFRSVELQASASQHSTRAEQSRLDMAVTIVQKATAATLRRGLRSPLLATSRSLLPAFTTLPVRTLRQSSRDAAPTGGMMGFGGSSFPPSYFQKQSLPANTIIRFVPQQTAWIVERMGKFNRILQPGLAILVPFLDRIAYVKSLKEVAIEIPSQSAITADNVTLELDGVLYTRVFDAYKARFVPCSSAKSPFPAIKPMLTNLPPQATASKTPNTPSPSSPRPPCAAKSANLPSTTSSRSAPPSTPTSPPPSTRPPRHGA